MHYNKNPDYIPQVVVFYLKMTAGYKYMTLFNALVPNLEEGYCDDTYPSIAYLYTCYVVNSSANKTLANNERDNFNRP